ncbi:hypothetical protein J3R83DRAFT_7303 [Lanmaoa asiatica]|nr:hypothetical protein J3R83DRAFT_7303 [Lanmaoa asiatica]
MSDGMWRVIHHLLIGFVGLAFAHPCLDVVLQVLGSTRFPGSSPDSSTNRYVRSCRGVYATSLVSRDTRTIPKDTNFCVQCEDETHDHSAKIEGDVATSALELEG